MNSSLTIRIKQKYLKIFFFSQNTTDETNETDETNNFENRHNETIDSIHLSPLKSKLVSSHWKLAKLRDLILWMTEPWKKSLVPYCLPSVISLITRCLQDNFLKHGSKPTLLLSISLLSAVGNVLEKLVHKYVFRFFRDSDIITSLQSGFVPGDSTVNQLIDIYDTFCKALDKGKEVRAVFCDVSNLAFDRVWNKALLYKLKRAGIRGFSSFLVY